MDVFHRELSSTYDYIEIYPAGDLHREDKLHNYKKAEKWRDEILEKNNRFTILNGDIFNMATKNSVTDIYGQTMEPEQAIDSVVEFLEPIADRILAIQPGNHETNRIYNQVGLKLLRSVSKELGIKDYYGENGILLFLSFGKSQGRDCRKTVYSVYCRHGTGGGRKTGSKANKLVDMSEIIDADLYIHSHTHQPMILPKPYLRCDKRNKKITYIDKLFVNTNAFLNYGGYGEEKGFPPASTCYPKVTLDGYERKMKAEIEVS